MPDRTTFLIPVVYRVEGDPADPNAAWEKFAVSLRDDERAVFCGGPRIDTGCETFNVDVYDADGSTSDLLPDADDEPAHQSGYIDLSPAGAEQTVVLDGARLSRAMHAAVTVVPHGATRVEVEWCGTEYADDGNCWVRPSGGQQVQVPITSVLVGYRETETHARRAAHGLPPRGPAA